MFQFPGFPRHNYVFIMPYHNITCDEFPHSDICGSSSICNSPQLFAACHVLLRRHVPRHPPYALRSLFFISILLKVVFRLLLLFLKKILSTVFRINLDQIFFIFDLISLFLIFSRFAFLYLFNFFVSHKFTSPSANLSARFRFNKSTLSYAVVNLQFT